ncbi:peptidylprolyl isomerase [Sulfuritalea hydrogenivorans]|uniref:Chaperone SurA n=1 Tax=Sulfuritalea hydrogenivorans sk43H TaxID=1223802 RepID=W0SCE1_9PROT|nr:peptidylprolyl isomerase [Sulfuritalea hydrogenivorans]MDK9716159.1 peptidylprolyl isomerase [Sulfuritalea sp.]BAO28592.1 parvulin-like peptidyl-prolyl isomerase [Sulfuritalea hydrogenivorans sk43H]
MIYRLLLICLLSGLFFPAHAQTRRAQPIEVDRIIAVVNNEAITAFELRSRLATVERQLRGQNVQLPPSDVLERQLLERMITDRVQLQFARETGLRISDIELDAAIRRIAEGNRLSLQDFRATLEKDGIAWPKFREEIREEIILSRLRDREVESRIVISDGEIDNYLANPDQGGSAENIEVQTAHIVLRVPEQASPDQLMRIGARAQAALDQIRRGESFAKVAASYSDAPDGLSGGAMGARPLDRLPALYADAIKTLKPGETSDILRSPAGFHIVKLVDRQGGGAKPVVALKQTRARHILIKVNELVSEAEARRKLVALKERLDNGADFAELARLHSNDLSAAKGGDLGWLYQGDTVPDFEKGMDRLKINQISEPIQSPFGFHLIQVLERRTEDATAERQRLSARQVLRERKSDEAYQDWVRQMRDRAYVEYRSEDR